MKTTIPSLGWLIPWNRNQLTKHFPDFFWPGTKELRYFLLLDLLWARAHPWLRFKSKKFLGTVQASLLSDGHIDWLFLNSTPPHSTYRLQSLLSQETNTSHPLKDGQPALGEALVAHPLLLSARPQLLLCCSLQLLLHHPPHQGGTFDFWNICLTLSKGQPSICQMMMEYLNTE